MGGDRGRHPLARPRASCAQQCPIHGPATRSWGPYDSGAEGRSRASRRRRMRGQKSNLALPRHPAVCTTTAPLRLTPRLSVTLSAIATLYRLAPSTLRKYRDEGIDIHDPRRVFERMMMSDSSRIEALGRVEHIVRHPELWPAPSETRVPNAELGARLGTSGRTISRWRSRGVDVTNPRAVAAHIASTRSPARGAVEAALNSIK